MHHSSTSEMQRQMIVTGIVQSSDRVDNSTHNTDKTKNVGRIQTNPMCWRYSDSGEVLAVCEATTQLLSAALAPAKIVFFIDFQAAFFALSSNTPTDYLNTMPRVDLKLWSSSHMAGLRPYSGSQVILGSPAMKEPTKKPSREPSRLNRKSPRPSKEQRALSPHILTNILL
ncbi:hypothetical protein TNCV_857371 [Trichonephila clavipes]|nr:hypothetical protein TNCV_857371 [Trichonephila clavipes]